MRGRDKFLYSQNWNIGFCEQTPESLVKEKKLSKVRWLKHPYRDRWFADPFILKADEREIIVFVEECLISNHPKGIITELVIDRESMRLKERYVLLEKDTHLSYPAIIEHDGKVYVYPENGASGMLNIYEYDSVNHKLINSVCILDEPVADASIFEANGQYYLIATKFPETQEKAYIYKSDSLFGMFKLVQTAPFQIDRSCSRQGGNWFTADSQLYRPAQDCVARYGSALSIMKVLEFNNEPREEKVFSISPDSFKYNRGLHTLNFLNNICVVDGYGYLYPIVGNFYNSLWRIKHLIFG